MPLITQGVNSILREASAVTKRYHDPIRFSRSKRRAVEAEFTDAEVTSTGGAMLLAEADRRMGQTLAAADAIATADAAKALSTPPVTSSGRGFTASSSGTRVSTTTAGWVLTRRCRRTEGSSSGSYASRRRPSCGTGRWPARRICAGSSASPRPGRRSSCTGCCSSSS